MSGEIIRAPQRRWARALLATFFAFGAVASVVTIAALLAGGALDAVWRLNPEAHEGFRQIGTRWSVLLMVVVGSACAAAAYGLARRHTWGRRLALGILFVNLLGDSATALVRYDPRTLIGLPIGGGMMFYLWRSEA